VSRKKGSRHQDQSPQILLLICVLTYFFKLYQIFFKSAFLVVCDITIFSKRYHDFFKNKFHDFFKWIS